MTARFAYARSAEVHADFMSRALFHAARGQGRTTPNPMVGAIVVSAEDVVVGHGWHERAGAAHAEVNALDEAGEAARGGTLYVTLEPCCHAGRTGPCTKRIISSGVGRVVAAMCDPDPRVSGRGFAELRAAGIDVVEGEGEREARELNAPFISVKTRERPFVILKAASSVDAKIALPGERTRLSSRDADRKTHRLRASVDAIAVGSGTLETDDPLLTARESRRIRPLVRVVFDRRLRTSPQARVFSTLSEGPVIILTSRWALDREGDRVRRLEDAGATLRAFNNLDNAVRLLLEWEVSTLLVEGGAKLHAAFLETGLVDRVHLIVTPRALGAAGIDLFDRHRVALSALARMTVEPRGADIWIEADVHRSR